MSDRLTKWFKNQFSLDPQEQDFASAETAGDVALGFIPGVGQAMALRDMERARRASDPVAGALAGASLLPWGRLGGAVKNKIIAGSNAKHAPRAEMQAGKDALDAGFDAKEVWQDLGVMQGIENHAPMKWEIPDQAAKVNLLPGESTEGKLGDVLRHPEFFRNYPEAHDWNLKASMGPNETGAGLFNAAADSGFPALEATGRNPTEFLQTLLHEVQHGVQHLEGFDPGSNDATILRAILHKLKSSGPIPESNMQSLKDAAFELYRRNAGEVEARNVETRFLRKPVLNMLVPPFMTHDVPISKQKLEEELPRIKYFDGGLL